MSHSAGYAIGTITAFILLYGGILALGAFFTNRLARKRGVLFVRWPIGLAFGVVLLLLAGQCANLGRAQEPAAKGAGDVVVSQRYFGSAAGFPGEFSPDFVREYNGGLREGILESLNEHGAGLVIDDVAVSTDVTVMGGNKVLQSRAEVPRRLFVHQYAGASHGKVVLVICTSRTGRPFAVAGTECERQATRVFGG